MFRKVQMKFFAIITCILLAVFIAVLVSINLIMEAVMQRQTMVVLKQIAAGIEYDDNTSTFTYFPPDNGGNMPPDDGILPEPPPDKPIGPAEEFPTGEAAPPDGTVPTDKPTAGTQENTQGTEENNGTEPQTTTTAVGSQRPEESHTTVTGGLQQSVVTTADSGEESTPPAATTAPELPPAITGTMPPPFPPEEYPIETRPPWEQRPGNEEGVYPPERDDRPHYDDDYNYEDEDSTEYPREFEDWDKEFHYGNYESFTYPTQPEVYQDEQGGGEADAEPEPTLSTETTEPSADGITPLSAGRTPVLSDGYTVYASRSAAPVRLMADNAAVTRDSGRDVPKSLGSIDFFVLMADENGSFLASLNNEELGADAAQTYITAIMDEGATNGMLNSYQFFSLGKENGTIFVLTDKSAEMDMLDQLTRTTILIGVVAFVVLSIIAYYFSKKSIEPIKLAFEKQKQFISDASHELKTPLTVISANADVLSGEIGRNKWLTYIKTQTDRMNVLVNDLLSLTRLENNTSDFICTDFDLSKAVENTALPFECRAFEENRTFEIDIEEGLTVSGSEKHIKQMTAIFIDNALKYSNENGTVRVTLSAQGDKKVLSVFNTGTGIKESEKDKIFERFYRTDDSRTRISEGGYGLGLAIAKSIIDRHKFRVTIDNHEGESICFNIIM